MIGIYIQFHCVRVKISISIINTVARLTRDLRIHTSFTYSSLVGNNLPALTEIYAKVRCNRQDKEALHTHIIRQGCLYHKIELSTGAIIYTYIYIYDFSKILKGAPILFTSLPSRYLDTTRWWQNYWPDYADVEAWTCWHRKSTIKNKTECHEFGYVWDSVTIQDVSNTKIYAVSTNCFNLFLCLW